VWPRVDVTNLVYQVASSTLCILEGWTGFSLVALEAATLSLSPSRHHIACLHPGTSTLRVRGCAEGMPTFADKSREQLKARASAATAAGYNQLDDSDSPSQFALRTKNFALARKKVDAAEVIQRRYRSYVNMWRHYGPSAFVGRQPDQIANFGKCFFPCVLRLGRHHRTHP